MSESSQPTSNPNLCEECGKPATQWIRRDPFGKSDAMRPACAEHGLRLRDPADVAEIERLHALLGQRPEQARLCHDGHEPVVHFHEECPLCETLDAPTDESTQIPPTQTRRDAFLAWWKSVWAPNDPRSSPGFDAEMEKWSWDAWRAGGDYERQRLSVETAGNPLVESSLTVWETSTVEQLEHFMRVCRGWLAQREAAMPCQHDRFKPGFTLQWLGSTPDMRVHTHRFQCKVCRETFDLAIGEAQLSAEKAKCEHAQEIGSYCGECPSDIAE